LRPLAQPPPPPGGGGGGGSNYRAKGLARFVLRRYYYSLFRNTTKLS
jgi:hypothetical protein